MRKWMRDRMKRRTKSGKPDEGTGKDQEQKTGPAPLQPTFLDRDSEYHADDSKAERPEPKPEHSHASKEDRQPEYEAQPEADPQDHEDDGGPQEAAPAAAAGAKSRPDRGKNRRRGRGGRGRNRNRGDKPAAGPAPVVFQPGFATGEASEVDVPPEEAAEPTQAPKAQPKKGRAPKGAVVLAIGLPGSGKSSWFRRHNIIPLSSDLIRGLLFDDATEQRFQDLVFSSLRYMLRMRMVAGRPTNYIDATNLSPKERHSWIKMARDFNYEAHAVFFDVPTEICMERNRKRSRNVPDDIMVRMAQKLRPPKFEEGFSKITIVRLKKHEGVPRHDDHEPLQPEE
jgi:predicted kinase